LIANLKIAKPNKKRENFDPFIYTIRVSDKNITQFRDLGLHNLKFV